MRDDWTAKRIGPRYCAPFCGAGCTWAQHEAAWKKARALVKKLGPEWVPHVWENMGWHYKVVLGAPLNDHSTGAIEVYSNVDHYTIFLQTSPQIVVSNVDVRDGLLDLSRHIRARVKDMNIAIGELNRVDLKLPRGKK